jgi:RNA polymerase sigma factor for flagellar operon FliA
MTAECQGPQQLIEGHQGLVRSLALRIHRKLPSHLELDDLIAYGQVGLAEAARDFDPTRGSQFSTYAYYRIRGAIYDGLSKMTWFSRSQYKQLRYEQMANEVLGVEGEPGEASSVGSMENAMRWFRDLSRALAVVYLTTQKEGTDDRGPSPLEDTSTPAPPAAAIGREIRQKLRELIDALPSEAGALIRATYFEGLTLQEAGRRLGISKSWASRLHAKTLQRLARSLRLLGVAS